MKTFMQMWFAASVLAMLFVSTGGVLAQEKFSGTYAVYGKDVIVKTDKYEIEPGKSYIDEIKGTAENDTAQRYETILENNKFVSMEQRAGDIIATAIRFKNNVFSFYEKTAMVGALPDENRSPVFDGSVYSHYALLLGLFDQSGGSKQTISVVIPALQDFINVEIEKHGSDVFKLGEQTVTANHYRFAIGKKRETVNLWADSNKVIAVYLASKNTFVIDGGYPGLYDRVKQLINRPM